MNLGLAPRSRRAALVSVPLVVGVLLSGCGGSTGQGQTATAPATPSAKSSAAQAEDKFISAIGGGMGDHSRAGLVVLGERACGAFSEGASTADIRDIFVRKGLTEAQASRIILAAVVSYCPEYKEKANP